ncbi:hypothetical protein IAQ61_009898 [Plenodomus lingam]|uniref:uncharacterized protein n=1 Tax=Leptosphaeria maculans TaxID=5022 RepID=UPI00331E2A99|nr:hypothetical protein IAQ61_009898 [Plenodomus lingam]
MRVKRRQTSKSVAQRLMRNDFRARHGAVSESRPVSKQLNDAPRVLAIASDVFVRLATLPYYRLYHFNTSDPLARIARLASEPEPNTKILRRAISAWRLHKLSELQFITIAVSVDAIIQQPPV